MRYCLSTFVFLKLFLPMDRSSTRFEDGGLVARASYQPRNAVVLKRSRPSIKRLAVIIRAFAPGIMWKLPSTLDDKVTGTDYSNQTTEYHNTSTENEKKSTTEKTKYHKTVMAFQKWRTGCTFEKVVVCRIFTRHLICSVIKVQIFTQLFEVIS